LRHNLASGLRQNDWVGVTAALDAAAKTEFTARPLAISMCGWNVTGWCSAGHVQVLSVVSAWLDRWVLRGA
jgi:hypothetical protein